MDKKVLVMCTGNSCRSIIGEAIINKYLNKVTAYSCGVKPTGKVNLNAKNILKENNIWNDNYYSKHLDEIIDMDISFDLIVTVCEDAKELCPIFPKSTPTVHIGFDDPDGKEYIVFKNTYQDIKDKLIPKVEEILLKEKTMEKSVFKTEEGVKISFTGVVQKKQILNMVENCAEGKCECMSDETKQKITNIEVDGENGNVELNLSGDIDKEEIERALAKSKVLN